MSETGPGKEATPAGLGPGWDAPAAEPGGGLGASAVTGAAALGATLALALVLGVPRPFVHDELSYLLAGDTFAHGRVTNPQHAMWVHLETFHVLQTPTYASKYPPGQGLFLALGQVLGGSPYLGICLSVALLCAAISWMLHALVPRRWALYGSALAVSHYALRVDWARSYWGGAVCATGGALAIGAAVRLAGRPRARAALVLGLGLAILANSRPWEGAAVAAVLAIWLARRVPRAEVLPAVVVPVALVMVPTAALMAYYNWRVTGSWLQFPYALHLAQYVATPALLFLPDRAPPVYRHALFQQFALGLERAWYEQQQGVAGLIQGMVAKLAIFGASLGPLLAWSVGLPLAAGWRWRRLLLAMVGANLLAVFSTTWMGTRFMAPSTAAVLGLVVASLAAAADALGRSSVPALRREWTRRVALAAVLAATAAAAVAGDVAALRSPLAAARAMESRDRLAAQLSSRGRPVLVLIRYGPEHGPYGEWVSNSAEVDAQGIVWARAMGEEADAELLRYYGGREAWLADVDGATDERVKLTRLGGTAAPGEVSPGGRSQGDGATPR